MWGMTFEKSLEMFYPGYRRNSVDTLQEQLRKLTSGGPGVTHIANETLFDDSAAAIDKLDKVREILDWLPITTPELIRLRNANKITFDKQVNAITTCLIQLREIVASAQGKTVPQK